MKLSRLIRMVVFFIAGLTILVLFAWKAKTNPDSSLTGQDLNNDGVRDDIEKYINDNYQGEKTRIVARELHLSFQDAILHPEKWDWKRMIYADDCLSYINPSQANRISREMEAKTANTLARIRAYWKANARLSGGVYPGFAPSQKEACGFDKRLSE